MRISLNYDSSTIWKLPLGPAELEDSLRLMWSDFFRCYGAPGREPASRLNLEGMARAGLYLELAVVDELEMARLNGQFLNCFGPTNVLAFPAPEAALWSADIPDGAQSGIPGAGGPARPAPDGPDEPGGCAAYLGWLAMSPDTVRR